LNQCPYANNYQQQPARDIRPKLWFGLCRHKTSWKRPKIRARLNNFNMLADFTVLPISKTVGTRYLTFLLTMPKVNAIGVSNHVFANHQKKKQGRQHCRVLSVGPQ
jgi:hypothetical protein